MRDNFMSYSCQVFIYLSVKLPVDLESSYEEEKDILYVLPKAGITSFIKKTVVFLLHITTSLSTDYREQTVDSPGQFNFKVFSSLTHTHTLSFYNSKDMTYRKEFPSR